jgi:hypothetical protein
MERATLVWLLAACAWLCFLGIAVVCGVLRVRVLEPRLGERTAHVVGTLFVCLMLLCAIHFYVVASGLRGAWPLMKIGAFWTVLTAGFEFLFGRFVLGHSWRRLLGEYDVFSGRVWLLVLVTTFWGPVLSGMLLE